MRALFACFFVALPMAATAQNPICAPTGEIVAAAVEARKAGQGADAAKADITAGLGAANAPFAPAVQPLVDWVYELPQADLQKDVAGSWVTQCETQ
ncbi:DNA primase [Roseovarius autotrophicus]|uniref:DNA primase n=1 Tax=Roseovarius autotrophicus TaxID=2824121 RepID=UPI0019E760B5|nr:DNA primase [Roseovarius autotrophicus]MBE0452251.1 DNA primase [Roseovarius sp.]